MTDPAQPSHDTDDLLADFTDRLLEGKVTELDPASDEELRGLEDTVLRLHTAFPNDLMDEKTRGRLQAGFLERARRTGTSSPGLSRWAWQPRQGLALAFAAIAVLAIFLFIGPALFSTIGNNVQGTAVLSQLNTTLLILLSGVLVFLIWLGRRK